MDGQDVYIYSPTELIQHIETGTKWPNTWDVIFKYIFLVKYMPILIQMSLKFVSKGQ